MIAFAAIVIFFVVIVTAIDRAVFLPLARAKNIENDPDIKRERETGDTFGVAIVIGVLILVFLAAK